MDLKESRYKESQERHPWELARFKIILSFFQKIVRKNSRSVILDIGCGDLYFLECLEKLESNNNYYGIDTAFTASWINSHQQQEKTSSIHIYQDVESLPKLQEEVAVVFLLDVIEHIEEDTLFLKKILQNPNITSHTFFLITVPAYQSLFCSHDVFLEHYRRYNNESLKEVLNESGMEIIDIGYFFFSLLSIRWVQVGWEKWITTTPKQATGLVKWKGSKLISFILMYLLILDFRISQLIRKITGYKMPGLSNYVICKKSA